MKDFPIPTDSYVLDWEPGEQRVSTVNDEIRSDLTFEPDAFNQPTETLILAVEKADLHIQQQREQLSEIDRKCTAVLGWLIAGFIALCGAVFSSTLTDAGARFIVPSAYGLIVCIAAIFAIVRMSLYKRACYNAGESPVSFFNKYALKYVDENSDLDAAKLHLYLYLKRSTDRIAYNDEEQDMRVRGYRLCLWIIFIGLVLMVPVLLLSALYF